MNSDLINKLQKILALTASPVEGEAQAAAEHLQRLLTKHNLDIADLETKGHQQKPGVREEGHDLGKAAFKWKLDLADAIAEHYYCLALIDRRSKTVRFIGRPDNVESLRMLYAWFIDQIKRISAEERVKHKSETGEHVDPLRWQVGFGIGAAQRLGERLREQREREVEDAKEVTALVQSHSAEISDYLEEVYGYRADGRETKVQRESRERWEAEKERRRKLKEEDPEAYYRECPWDRPLTDEEKEKIEKENARWWKKQEARARRNGRRRSTERMRSDKELRKERQTERATDAGYDAARRVNLRPFVEGGEAHIERDKLT